MFGGIVLYSVAECVTGTWRYSFLGGGLCMEE
jgi:hypothetical protein